MKITKYLHSCLLVEEQNITILFDPGMFSTDVFDVGKLDKLDYLLITHEHKDHCSLPLVKKIVAKFPDITILTNQSVVGLLKKESIPAKSTDDPIVTLAQADHERLWDKEPPENVTITIFNKLTHVGDSLHLEKTADILALPIAAPWGSTTQAVEKALEVQPKVIIPIHDFMWKDEVRTGMYERLEAFFKKKGIDFKKIETGETLDLSLQEIK